MSCKIVNVPNALPGWGCCTCRCYNGAQRPTCRGCGHAYCGVGYEVARLEKVRTLEGDAVEVIVAIRETESGVVHEVGVSK